MTSKHFFITLICVLTVVILIAALAPHQDRQDTVNFYYVRSDFSYGSPDGVIGAEARNVGDHEGDLDYLLALYLGGPLDSQLVSPFPNRTTPRLLSVKVKGNILHINLSDLSTVMTDGKFTLACACLSKTCLELANVQAVEITSGNRSLRLTPANLVFYDESTSVLIPETEEEK